MENNNKQKRSTGTTVLIVFLLLVTIVAVILATYAWSKYTESIDGEATAQVAQWNVEVSADDTQFTKTFTHVVDKKMAPGTDGSIIATLDIGPVDVDVDYTISLENVEATEGVIPTNLVIRADNGDVIYKNKAKVVDENGSCIIASDTVEHTTTTQTIQKNMTWEWLYETPGEGETDEEIAAATEENNRQDTEDGKNPGTIKITYRIEAVQVQPTVPTEETEQTSPTETENQ